LVCSTTLRESQLCREHQLKDEVVRRWRDRFVAQAETIFVEDVQDDALRTQIAELERMVGRLTLQLDAAKKVSAHLDSPRRRNESL
jgi:transposase